MTADLLSGKTTDGITAACRTNDFHLLGTGRDQHKSGADLIAVFRFAHFHLAQLIEALCIHGGKSLGHMLCDDHAGNIGRKLF